MLKKDQSGIALAVTLMLLLVLMIMSAGLAYVGALHSDLFNGTSNKPMAIAAAESCIDQAIDWFGTSTGKTWVVGPGAALDLASTSQVLYGKNLMTDTVPTTISDSRSAAQLNQVSKAVFSSCIIKKLASTTIRGTGSEVGSSSAYASSSLSYTISVTAIGNFNIQMSGNAMNPLYWQSNSSKTNIEAIFDYIP
jgi:Tfp pilus assembly protein PilX